MRRAVAAAAVALALPLASCSGGGGDDDRYVLRLDGTAELADGTELGEGRHRLEVGDVVRITGGTATLGLPGERLLELRAGGDPSDDSRVEVGVEPTLVDGHALLVAGDDEVARLRSGDTDVVLQAGAARIRRSTGVTVAVYEGRAEVRSLGRSLEEPVRALRQVTVSGTGALPGRPSPLVFDRDDLDPWDRRYLGSAVALGGQLERMSLALSRSLDPPAPDDADWFRSVVPPLRAVEGFRPRVDVAPGENVVGASIVLGADGDFAGRWSSAWSFRDEGADWGLVALDQRADREAIFDVLGAILDAAAESIELAGGPFGGGAGSAESIPTAVGGGGGGATPDPGPGPGGGSGPTSPGATPTSPLTPLLPTIPPLLPGDDGDDGGGGVLPTVPEPQLPEPVGGLLDPVTQPVVDTLNGVVDTVDGLLGPVLGPLTGPLLR